MRSIACVYTLLICISAFQSSRILGQEATPLFNGKDLSGWVLVNTPPETWSAKDGMLICTGKPIGELRTEKMYHNFELELEWRHMVPGGNAGVFVWADDITSRGVPFHRSVEVQVLENAYGNSQSHTTHGDIFPIHGAKMTPINGRGGGNRAFPTEERSKPSPEWNHYRIVCNDGTISLAVNGKVVTQGKEASPRKGYICLESEGGVVHYRNLRIKELPATPVDAKDVAVSNRGYRSIYTGLNLEGWKVSEAGKGGWKVNDWVLAFDGSVAGEQARIETTESFQLNGFVMDFRFTEKSDRIAVTLPGSTEPLTLLAKGDSPFSASMEKVGSWNRIEAVAVDGHVQLLVNGKSHELTRSLGKGAIAIVPTGPVELANVYVR
jgi:Domain of Unknown Function (DUF1080)